MVCNWVGVIGNFLKNLVIWYFLLIFFILENEMLDIINCIFIVSSYSRNNG